MPHPLPPLASVRVFEAAARLLNFTLAAQELGMTQAAVSYQIKLLEERLGVPLFHRVGRRVERTEHGEALAPTIIRAFDQMRAGFASLSAEAGGVLTVSCTQTIAHLWLAPRIGLFQMTHPGIAVRIHASDQVVDFMQEPVDIAIRGGMGSWPGLDAELLMRIRIAPMCSPAFLDRLGNPARPVDLLDHPRLSPQSDWWHDWFTAMDVDPGAANPPPGLALDSQTMEGRAAIAGQGIAVLIPYLWRREIDAGLLVEPVTSYVADIMDYWVVYPHANRNLPKVKAFRDWISAEIAAEHALDPAGRFLPREKVIAGRTGVT